MQLLRERHRHERRRLLAALILVAGTLGFAGCREAAEVDSDLSAALQAQIDRDQAGYGVSGISAAVVLPNGAVWAGASGEADTKTGRKVHPETIFAIASVTKTFVAALVLDLAEDGKLSLDDRIGTWVPELPASKGANASLRQLLRHTSGIRDVFDHPDFERAFTQGDLPRTPQERLRYVGAPYFAPAEGYHYSNTNFLLLGLAIERAGKAPLAEQLQARLLEPLGLDRVTLQSSSAGLDDTAHGYSAINRDTPRRDISDGTAFVPNRRTSSWSWAAGGMAADARSLGVWADSLFGGDVLDKDSLAQMTDARDTGDYCEYGLGVMECRPDSRSKRRLGHYGQIDGFLSSMWYVPGDDVTVVVLVNDDTAPLDNITDNLLGVVDSHLAK